MFGLEFSPTALMNILAGGAITAFITIAMGWYMTRDQRDQIRYIANFLEWDREGRRPTFLRDEDEHVVGTRGQSEVTAGGSVNIQLPSEEEQRAANEASPGPWKDDGEHGRVE